MDLPPYSLDMNLIEHLQLGILQQKLVELFPGLEHDGWSVTVRAHFIKCAKVAWRAIPQEQIDNVPGASRLSLLQMAGRQSTRIFLCRTVQMSPDCVQFHGFVVLLGRA
jgi:hypothetical protein